MTQKTLELSSNLNLFPYSKEQKFCAFIWDIWEEIAKEIRTRDRSHPRFTYDDISSFRNSSNPPEKMLQAWKTDNVTFKDLLDVLKASNCLRGVSFIEGFLKTTPDLTEQGDQDELSFRLPYRTIKSWTNNFDRKNYMASGGFANVYKGQKKSGCKVAVKLFLEMDEYQKKMFTNEIDVLSQCKHSSLLEILHYANDGSLCVIYEYMENGSLYEYLCDEVKRLLFNMASRIKVSQQVSQGLAYLHSKNIVHRDIKSSNILLDKSMNAKIGDFGTARLMLKMDQSHLVTHTIVGTAMYMAPEYLQRREVSSRIDMYSFGVVLAELIEGLPAYDEHRQTKDILDIIENDNGPVGNIEQNEVFKTLKTLALDSISLDKYKRPTAEQAEETITDCLLKYQ